MDISILCDGIAKCINHLKCKRDHSHVVCFQAALTERLNELDTQYTWYKEHKEPTRIERDSIDIYGQAKNSPDWIIEIDPTRADQVSKKMLSRFALWGMTKESPVVYVALLYSDTQEGRNQSKKFIRYGDAILRKINPKSRVFGVILGNKCPNKDCYVDDTFIEIIDPRANSMFEIEDENTITGMPDCAQKAILKYAQSNKTKSYDKLKEKFGRYVSDCPGKSRYKKSGITVDKIEIHTYTQFRHFSNWPNFISICNKLGIIINELNCWYTHNGISYSESPVKYYP